MPTVAELNAVFTASIEQLQTRFNQAADAVEKLELSTRESSAAMKQAAQDVARTFKLESDAAVRSAQLTLEAARRGANERVAEAQKVLQSTVQIEKQILSEQVASAKAAAAQVIAEQKQRIAAAEQIARAEIEAARQRAKFAPSPIEREAALRRIALANEVLAEEKRVAAQIIADSKRVAQEKIVDATRASQAQINSSRQMVQAAVDAGNKTVEQAQRILQTERLVTQQRRAAATAFMAQTRVMLATTNAALASSLKFISSSSILLTGPLSGIGSRLTALSVVAGTYGGAAAGAAAVTAGFAATMVKGVQAAATFESAMTKLGIVTGLSGNEFTLFGEDLKNLSRSLGLPLTTITDVAKTVAELGIEGRQNILVFTSALSQFGRLVQDETTNVQQLAQQFGVLLSVTNEAPQNIGRVTSAALVLAQSFNATAAQVLESGNAVARATSGFKISATDALALGAALRSAGVQAETGATAISRVAIAIDQATKSGGEKLSAIVSVIRESGETFEETAERFRQVAQRDLSEAIALVLDGLGRFSRSGGDVSRILDELGFAGVRTQKAIRPLAADFETSTEKLTGLRRALDDARRAFEQGTFMQEAFNKQSETAVRLLETLKTRMSLLAQTLGEQLLPVLNFVLGGLNNATGGNTALAESQLVASGAIAKTREELLTLILNLQKERSELQKVLELRILTTEGLKQAEEKAKLMNIALEVLSRRYFETARTTTDMVKATEDLTRRAAQFIAIHLDNAIINLSDAAVTARGKIEDLFGALASVRTEASLVSFGGLETQDVLSAFGILKDLGAEELDALKATFERAAGGVSDMSVAFDILVQKKMDSIAVDKELLSATAGLVGQLRKEKEIQDELAKAYESTADKIRDLVTERQNLIAQTEAFVRGGLKALEIEQARQALQVTTKTGVTVGPSPIPSEAGAVPTTSTAPAAVAGVAGSMAAVSTQADKAQQSVNRFSQSQQKLAREVRTTWVRLNEEWIQIQNVSEASSTASQSAEEYAVANTLVAEALQIAQSETQRQRQALIELGDGFLSARTEAQRTEAQLVAVRDRLRDLGDFNAAALVTAQLEELRSETEKTNATMLSTTEVSRIVDTNFNNILRSAVALGQEFNKGEAFAQALQQSYDQLIKAGADPLNKKMVALRMELEAQRIGVDRLKAEYAAFGQTLDSMGARGLSSFDQLGKSIEEIAATTDEFGRKVGEVFFGSRLGEAGQNLIGFGNAADAASISTQFFTDVVNALNSGSMDTLINLVRNGEQFVDEFGDSFRFVGQSLQGVTGIISQLRQAGLIPMNVQLQSGVGNLMALGQAMANFQNQVFGATAAVNDFNRATSSSATKSTFTGTSSSGRSQPIEGSTGHKSASGTSNVEFTASGSPTLPFTEYFERYVPFVLDKTSREIEKNFSLRMPITDMEGNDFSVAMGSLERELSASFEGRSSSPSRSFPSPAAVVARDFRAADGEGEGGLKLLELLKAIEQRMERQNKLLRENNVITSAGSEAQTNTNRALTSGRASATLTTRQENAVRRVTGTRERLI